MIEVDPKLFIKCRLCLEDSGTYQIDPSIREQICYCFDINVEPYDGLPQLICKKCQSILSDYDKTKRSFVGKQEELKKKIQENNVPNKNKLENFEPSVKEESSVCKLKNSDRDTSYQIKKRTISDSSISSFGSVRNHEPKNNIGTGHLTNQSTELTDTESWKKEYQKTFVCRICNSHWFSWDSAKKHKAKHRRLKSKHVDVLGGYCVVELPKIDDKLNITGSLDQVVFSKNKIIAKGNADYFIVYQYKGKNCNKTSDSESTNQNKDCNVEEDSDSSFRNNVIKGRHQRHKRRRICSRSSNETVVLENKSMEKSPGNECISIEDTDSDNEIKKSQKTKANNKKLINAKKGAVAKLIATTHNKYLKKYEKAEKPSLEQLNRKIISIGRQIINKRKFNCTRVMKYMEHMNLNVIWLSRSPLNVTNNSNYFKIIPRLRYPNEKNINDFAGYHKKYDKPIQLNRNTEATLIQKTSLVKNSRVKDVSVTGKSTEAEIFNESGESRLVGDASVIGKFSVVEESSVDQDAIVLEKPSVAGKSRVVEDSSVVTESNLVAATSDVEERLGRQYSETIHTVSINANIKRGLSILPSLNTTLYPDTRKLLNSNPVANPKQLPKKFFSDAQKEKAKSINMPTLEVNVNELSEVTSSGFENNIQMPIITFTTSLAVSEDQIMLIDDSSNNIVVDTVSVNSNSESPKPAPRIKVKSVAELMSPETLNRMQQPSAPQTQNQQVPQNGATNVQDTNSSCVSPPAYNCEDYIILDSVELPNTKTSSPFKYFRTLLQVHNLSLLDTDVTLSADFNTLIKFKVLYKQETKHLPVILCLSLFCSSNAFCLKIKDRNEDNINMSKISANWQWEILKIYRGEVVTKLLNNAQKISPEVMEYTNRFLCLLKSINFVSR